MEAFLAANRRLPLIHPTFTMVESKLTSLKAGLGGEQQLDKIFEDYRFPMKYHVFNDLSLESNTKFQLDSLFVTPSYAVVFEVKNIAGELTVKENPPQLVRTLDNGKMNGFKSPIDQVQNNCQLLQDWLHYRQINLTVYGVVVLAYAKNPVHLFDTPIPFLYPAAIPRYIRSLPTDPQLLDESTFLKLSDELLEAHREFIPSPICSTFQIDKHEIITGVQCKSCSFFGMNKYSGGWRCGKCTWTSATAHEQAIRDWFYLFGGRMSNKDCRDFLHVDRQQTAYRLMKGMRMVGDGSKRNRTYTLD